MNNILTLNKNVTSKTLLNFGFKKIVHNRYIINKILYNPLIFLRMEINLNEKEVIWEVIDKNTQNTYYPFWFNYNEKRNLVALEVIKNFNEYILELQNEKILTKNKRSNNEKNCKISKSK